jgi:two-component system response regulator HydG
VQITVPPLRDRVDDIPPLLDAFLAKAKARNPTSQVEALSAEVRRLLSRCPWPGNVRELENVVERLVILSGGTEVQLADVEAHAPFLLEDGSPLARAKVDLIPLKQLEREYLAWVVAKCGGNKVKAAEILQIDLSTIYRRGKSAQ